ncbi:MAG: cobalt-precorrin-5B (C(1))-methyltransferase [Desulfobulbaceae bacterium]|nr:cobalt-precorrin-5B (C(1))-methyltransferase [Desulfobulbaceae bacterium]
MKQIARKKRLRSGFTTGACAAAAAKAACRLLLTGKTASEVSIPFPDGLHRSFAVASCRKLNTNQAQASIIKDAGDDPDVTNGAEIKTIVALAPSPVVGEPVTLRFTAGEGVGTVTKPGLALAVGEPAINPVPRQMITEAVLEALADHPIPEPLLVTITIAVENGQKLAEKTLNHRLGIIGGLSILGSTGIVRPVSAEAWTATILASMAVAKETGCQAIVLSTGRTSEMAVQKTLGLPVEAYAMMGDYLHFSLSNAARFGFQQIHLAGMWAKILKAAMGTPQTHVRHGALEVSTAANFIGTLAGNPALGAELAQANTAREIYSRLVDMHRQDLITSVCLAAKQYAEKVGKLPVSVHLVSSASQVACHV